MTANEDQIKFWNEKAGRDWTELQTRMDTNLSGLHGAVMALAAPLFPLDPDHARDRRQLRRLSQLVVPGVKPSICAVCRADRSGLIGPIPGAAHRPSTRRT